MDNEPEKPKEKKSRKGWQPIGNLAVQRPDGSGKYVQVGGVFYLKRRSGTGALVVVPKDGETINLSGKQAGFIWLNHNHFQVVVVKGATIFPL